MRIIYFDIDSLRPDHLGCYGYHHRTSPNIDAIATRGVRFNQCYVSDAPCLPSRSSLFSGQFGIRHGAVAHSGERSRPFEEPRSGLHAARDDCSWMGLLRQAGYTTASVSSFASRHSAWHIHAGFTETYDTGHRGHETVDHVEPTVIDWLRRRGASDNWFLHVNLWDVHVPYRTPAAYGEPFAENLPPAWHTEVVRRKHYDLPGLRSARHVLHFGHQYDRYPVAIDSPAAFERLINGYDTAVRYVDDHIGRVMALLESLGIADDTAILISADHGETLGELNAYGAHLFADPHTTQVPLILKWPVVTDAVAGSAMCALCHPQDIAAAICGLVGQKTPDAWDGDARFIDLVSPSHAGRSHVITSQLAQSLQRGVRFDVAGTPYFTLRSYDDAFHAFPEWMLFDLQADPHLQIDLATNRREIVRQAAAILREWEADALARSGRPDPLVELLGERNRTRLDHVHLRALESAGQPDWATHFRQRQHGFERETIF